MHCKLSNASLDGVWGWRKGNGIKLGHSADAINILRSFSVFIVASFISSSENKVKVGVRSARKRIYTFAAFNNQLWLPARALA